jgi:hypothetical protein
MVQKQIDDENMFELQCSYNGTYLCSLTKREFKELVLFLFEHGVGTTEIKHREDIFNWYGDIGHMYIDTSENFAVDLHVGVMSSKLTSEECIDFAGHLLRAATFANQRRANKVASIRRKADIDVLKTLGNKDYIKDLLKNLPDNLGDDE